MEVLGAGHIYPTARGEQPAPGVTAELDVQDTRDRDISKEAVDKKKKTIHYSPGEAERTVVAEQRG